MKLQMCPLCCAPERTNMEVYWDENVEGNEQYKAGCGSCACSTPPFKTKIEAAEFWNTRFFKPLKDNCPMCNSIPEFLEFKIHDKQIDPFFRYICNSCGFAGGMSKNKQQIMDSWTKNRWS